MTTTASDMPDDARNPAGVTATGPKLGPAPGNNPGFGVYVHWPFCASKCPYCDFNSHVRHTGIDELRFLAAYKIEIAHMAQLTAHDRQPVSSIFFGGGTPSLMQPQTVAAIIDTIADHWTMAPDVEITLEANPSSVEVNRFRGYRSAGINRVSLGVQSLLDRDLKALGRLHSALEARDAINIAARCFDRYSFDLIYARPHQTLDAWQSELNDALALSPTHLSLYQLTIEDGTAFAALHKAGRLHIPADEPAHDLFALTQEMLSAKDLSAYEISNHALSDEESRHNLLYWRYGCYAGIGAGAHGRLNLGISDGHSLTESKISQRHLQTNQLEAAPRTHISKVGRGPRKRRHALATLKLPEAWLEQVEARGHGLCETTALAAAEQADEMLLMGLRLTEGLDLSRLRQISGLTPDESCLDELVQLDLLERVVAQDRAPSLATSATARVRATPKGRFVLNQLVLRLSESLTAATV